MPCRNSATVKAKGFKSGFLDSSTATASFVINQSFSGTDSDGDGLSDQWEQTFFGNLGQNAGGDWDADGLTNLQEYQQGTNPIVGLSLEVFNLLR